MFWETDLYGLTISVVAMLAFAGVVTWALSRPRGQIEADSRICLHDD